MAKIKRLRLSRGKVTLSCQGSHRAITSFLNQAVQAHLQLENISWVSSDQMEFTLFLSDFYRAIKILKKYHLRMKIVEKSGFPFWLYHMKTRKFFYLGILLFVCLLFVFSSFIWRIDIKGTEHISEELVRSLLKQEGVYVGQLKYRLKDQEQIRHRLLSRIPESVWIGIQIEGTRALITIVEKKQVEKSQDDLPAHGPVHLVAKKAAMITDMKVEKGNPLVGVHDIVEKGELLVSGIYGDLENETSGNIIGAKGKVFGEVWYEADVEIPTSQTRKVFTGTSEKVILLYFRSWTVMRPFFKPGFKNYEILEKERPIYLGKWKLPFGWIEREYLQMKETKYKLSEAEARSIGKRKAAEELKQTLGEDGKILVQKVLHQRSENGKVYLKIHFDAIENIAVPKPIIQGE